MNTTGKSLLVRADFALGDGSGTDRRTLKRWRRILGDVLPVLMGCANRSPKAERVRLRTGPDGCWFSVWVRLPIERRPSRRRLRKLKAKLRARLEVGLGPVAGRVLKLGVRRIRPRVPAAPLPLFDHLPAECAAA